MTKMLPTRNSLPQTTRATVTEVLNQVLADLFDLYSLTKQAHWNVRGPGFFQLHKLFDELADLAEASVDPLAERITALGGVARGTVRQAAETSALPEFPLTLESDLAYVDAVAERFAIVGAGVRKGIDATAQLGDAGSSDLLTGLSQELDKGLWLLEAHSRE